MLLGTLRSEWRERARNMSIDGREIDLLLSIALGRSTAWVFAHDDHELSDEKVEEIEQLLVRRLGGEPTQYVRGTTEFYGRTFRVDDRALIPRPETEIIVEQILKRTTGAIRALDLCCGSGCIGVTIALERPEASVAASDISIEALALAHWNASNLGADVDFVASDVLEGLNGTWDAIAANPPYIPGYEMSGLQREVRDYEPHVALTPGNEGTEIIARMLHDAHRVLVPGGIMVSEMGWNQSGRVTDMAEAAGWVVESIEPDLSGTLRCAVLRRPA